MIEILLACHLVRMQHSLPPAPMPGIRHRDLLRLALAPAILCLLVLVLEHAGG